jgi:hypothetical protein
VTCRVATPSRYGITVRDGVKIGGLGGKQVISGLQRRADAHKKCRGSSLRSSRTRTANAIRFHFGERATTNSAASETFDFMEFEMKHCASTLSHDFAGTFEFGFVFEAYARSNHNFCDAVLAFDIFEQAFTRRPQSHSVMQL